MDMKKLLKQAQQMQQQFQQAQDELAEKEFTAQSGGGMVSVTVDGQGQVKDIDIDSEVVDPDDVEMLEDMILTAVENATEKADEHKEEAMGDMGMPDSMGNMGNLLG